MGGATRRGGTGTFQWVNPGVNNWTVWTDACTFLSGCLSLTPLLLCPPPPLIQSPPPQRCRFPRRPSRTGRARGGAEEACAGGSPASDWPGRPAWIGASAREVTAAGFSPTGRFSPTPPRSRAPRPWRAAWRRASPMTTNRG